MDPEFHKQSTLPGVEAQEREIHEEVPSQIGPYKIEGLLEKGGMSYIYLATHPDTQEPVVVKALFKKYLNFPDVVKRFLNEAEIISLADHPNVVKLYGQGEWDGGLYIAMEFIQGGSLRQHLQTTPMSLRKSLELILEISYALCHLHTHGIIHRDLKLENILITNEEVIKVIDFGIAQLLTEQDAITKKTSQRIIGTPIYMSPEQRLDPESVSYPSDIYSLGIIAYELVLGKLSHGKIHLSLMPKGLQKILSKTLQSNPEERYQDLVDFISDLSGYMNSAKIKEESSVQEKTHEIREQLSLAHKNILGSEKPTWSNESIEVITSAGKEIASPYCQFIDLPDETQAIVIATGSTPGPEGIISTAILHGILQALTTKDQLETLIEDLSVSICVLFKDKKTNQVTPLITGNGILWYISENKELKSISQGTDKSKIEWNLNDTLLMTPENYMNEEELQTFLSNEDFQLFSKKIDAFLTKKMGKKPFGFIALTREK